MRLHSTSTTPSARLSAGVNPAIEVGEGDKDSEIRVSWWDAIAYCNWLSKKEGLPKAYDSNGIVDKDGRVSTDPSKVVGYRLPTEAEWNMRQEVGTRGDKKVAITKMKLPGTGRTRG